MSEKHQQLPNELLHGLCRNILMVKTSDEILLTAVNIWTYLAPRFRKKAIYRDVIAFVKAKLNEKRGEVGIRIYLIPNANDEEEHVMHKQHDGVFELKTNQLRIQVNHYQDMPYRKRYIIGLNAQKHVYLFVQLIVTHLQPIALLNEMLFDSSLSSANLAVYLNALNGYCIGEIHLTAQQFMSLNSSANTALKLAKCNRLTFLCNKTAFLFSLPKQFRDALMQWLNANNNGQPKYCVFNPTIMQRQELDRMLLLFEELKMAFCRATTESSFAVCIRVYNQANLELAQLFAFSVCNVGNDIGEMLELKHKKRCQESANGNIDEFVLIRRSIDNFESNWRMMCLDYGAEELARLYLSVITDD